MWTDLDEIWGTPSILFGAVPDISWRDPHRINSGRPCGSFVFLSGKQRTTLPISGQPNFTKFAQIRDSVTWRIVSERVFENLPLRGLFPKNRDHRQWFSPSSRDFSEMITNLETSWQVGAPTECWLSIRTVGINLKSFPWTAESVYRMTFIDASLPNGHAALTWHYIITNSFAGRQHHLDVALLFSFE